jgi:hypothetical protein
MHRPSDFSDGTWEDRYNRDLERVGPVRPAPRVTADDQLERAVFAAGLTCSCHDDEQQDDDHEQLELAEVGGES